MQMRSIAEVVEGHKGPKVMTDDDRKKFLQTLTKILEHLQELKLH